MKLIFRVADELVRGPASSRDIADELGISVACASAVLSDLFQAGVLTRRRGPRSGDASRGLGPYIYEFKDGEV